MSMVAQAVDGKTETAVPQLACPSSEADILAMLAGSPTLPDLVVEPLCRGALCYDQKHNAGLHAIGTQVMNTCSCQQLCSC